MAQPDNIIRPTEFCESCEGLGCINCHPDEDGETHLCDDCQPDHKKMVSTADRQAALEALRRNPWGSGFVSGGMKVQIINDTIKSALTAPVPKEIADFMETMGNLLPRVMGDLLFFTNVATSKHDRSIIAEVEDAIKQLEDALDPLRPPREISRDTRDETDRCCCECGVHFDGTPEDDYCTPCFERLEGR